jgi:hypothetical protein
MRLLSSEERIAALDHGMKEVLYLGKEVAGVLWRPATNSAS